jgi:integrase/recombinase XerD
LNVLFYCCLRASELCAINDEDVDFNALTIRIKEGKGNKEGICFLNDQTASILKRYLSIRPPLEIDGKQPLFFTDYGKRWDRRDLYRMFSTYKDKAGVKMKGGLHVFARHSTASLMIANGCDISIVQKLLRHSDIRTTMRYTHLSDRLQRESHRQFLKL